MRIALAQCDPTVGDLAGNAALVRGWTRKAVDAGAHLVAFPEMMLTGYPVEDLVFRDTFVAASRAALESLAGRLVEDGLGATPVVVGYLDADGEVPPAPTAERGPRNALAVLHRGRVALTYFKHHLPNYGVFDEDRYFVPGDTLSVMRYGGVDIAFTICEDLWQAGGPFAVAARAEVGLVININGSPYELDKEDVRLPLVQRRAAEAGATVAYVNMVGGQDELVFDGDSMVIGPDGAVLARAAQFAEELLVVDLDLPMATAGPVPRPRKGEMRIKRRVLPGRLQHTAAQLVDAAVGRVADRLSDDAAAWQALVLGLRDYVRKNGFRSVILGLSGGIDSSVVAAVAVDALGPNQVFGVSMPSRHSSEHSSGDAADLAKRTGLHYLVEPIQPMVDEFLANMPLGGVAGENLQARVRGIVLMALSNKDGHLVLTTGNKSELAVGYSTLYGDSVGGFNPLKDVFKTHVWRLARWRNAEAERRGELPPIPENSITKPPSAELRPGQLDSDSLPDYVELDAILAGYIDGDLGRDELVAAGHDPAMVDRVLHMVDLAEYKRRQSAPGPKVSIKAFGRDRRLPITNRFQG
jgi:NAD+ synthase (glutamine-hydrolysing)